MNSKLISTTVLTCMLLGAATVARAQTYDYIHTFNGPPEEGANPYAGMIQTANGRFYGTTANGGENNCGTVFTMDEVNGGAFLHHMATYEGCAPTGLLLASDGFFYGLTKNNGPSGAGTLFRMNADGQVTVLHPFDAATEGMGAVSALIQATDGLLYGTMPSGGINGQGTVFRASLSGAIAVLHAFGSGASDGIRPLSPLTQDWSGQLVFYGTTFYGGNPNAPDCDPCDRQPGGTVYQMTVNGDVGTMFYWFNFEVGGGNGDSPVGGLVQTGPTTFFGTTTSLANLIIFNDPPNVGTIFALSTSGEFSGMSTVYSFPVTETFDEGLMPFATLMRAGDGHLYGTTSGAPGAGAGTVFRFRLDGYTLETLHAFDDSYGSAAPLVEGIDGHLYGSTSGSIPYFDSPTLPGTLFRMLMDLSGVVKENQTITFAPLPNKTTSAPDFFVSATASSSLRVSFSASGSCTISGAKVHLTGAGSCTITASQGGNAYYNAAPGVPRTFTIAEATPALTLSVSPASVAGGTSVTATVTLSSPAPNGGAVVNLASNAPGAASVPATLSIMKGKTTKTFTVTTFGVTAATPVTISASYAGTTATATLTVNPPPPPTLSALGVNPKGVSGGSTSTATVTLTRPAPAGGMLVTLTELDAERRGRYKCDRTGRVIVRDRSNHDQHGVHDDERDDYGDGRRCVALGDADRQEVGLRARILCTGSARQTAGRPSAVESFVPTTSSQEQRKRWLRVPSACAAPSISSASTNRNHAASNSTDSASAEVPVAGPRTAGPWCRGDGGTRTRRRASSPPSEPGRRPPRQLLRDAHLAELNRLTEKATGSVPPAAHEIALLDRPPMASASTMARADQLDESTIQLIQSRPMTYTSRIRSVRSTVWVIYKSFRINDL